MATKKERRIAVLKDAIKQIKAQKIIADPGSVVNLPTTIKWGNSIDLQGSLKDVFKNKSKDQYCSCCARGALLVSTVHKENDFTLDEMNNCYGSYGSDRVTDKRLLRLFSEEQLALMENAFEYRHQQYDSEEEAVEMGDPLDWYYGINYGIISNKKALKSLEFGKKYEDDTARLLAIFKNAVRNDGIFKP